MGEYRREPKNYDDYRVKGTAFEQIVKDGVIVGYKYWDRSGDVGSVGVEQYKDNIKQSFYMCLWNLHVISPGRLMYLPIWSFDKALNRKIGEYELRFDSNKLILDVKNVNNGKEFHLPVDCDFEYGYFRVGGMTTAGMKKLGYYYQLIENSRRCFSTSALRMAPDNETDARALSDFRRLEKDYKKAVE